MQEGVHQEDFSESTQPVSLSTCLCFHLTLFLPVSLSFCLSTCLSCCMSVCLPVSLSASVKVLVARQAIRAKRRITRRVIKQRLIDSRRILKKLRLLAKEVRGHTNTTAVTWRWSVHLTSDPLLPYSAPEHSPRCVSMVIKWKQAIGLCQDPLLLRAVLIGGGAEGAGL